VPGLDGRKPQDRINVKFWEVIADNLSKAGWSWGCVATVDSNGETIFVADAHRDDGKHFVARADERLTAFLELEAAIRGSLFASLATFLVNWWRKFSFVIGDLAAIARFPKSFALFA
jgi:hypothetical protein